MAWLLLAEAGEMGWPHVAVIGLVLATVVLWLALRDW